MGKSIRLAFCDLAPDWDAADNYFTRLLEKGGYTLTVVQSPADKPDFVLCGTFGQEFLEYECPRILYSGEDSWPDLNVYDYAIGFPHLEFEGRYLRWPLYAMQDNWALALEKHRTPAGELLAKKKFCSFVVSNDFCTLRNEFFDILSRRGPVESGGRYRNNIGGPVSDKLAFQRQFRFAAAFENSSTPGYVTEKITDAFAAAAVPVYWGDPRIAAEFNPASFLSAFDFPTLDALADAVKEIFADDARWLAMAQAPILGADSLAARYADGAECFAFLDGIFTAGGLRRNRSCWGTIYEGDLRAAWRLLRESAVPPPFGVRLRRFLRGR